MFFSIIPFVVGAGGLTGFWCFRLWEAKRGVRVWDTRRRALDAAVGNAYHALVAGDALAAHRLRIFALVHAITHRSLAWFVDILRAVERPLARVSYRMRMAPPKAPAREPSEFLKTITPEKKSTETPDTL
jgi:hypothetical protein